MTGPPLPAPAAEKQKIEMALQLVRSGELSPAEATELLLASAASSEAESMPPAPEVESLESLIDRLGIPPADIAESWCTQLAHVAAILERQINEPLPPIELNEWGFDTGGHLVWRHHRFICDEPPARPRMQASLDHLRRFRDLLVASDGPPAATDANDLHKPPCTSLEHRPISSDASCPSSETTSNPCLSSSRRMVRRVGLATVLAGCAVAIFWILANTSSPSLESETADANLPLKQESSGSTPPTEASRADIDAPIVDLDENASSRLETLDSIAESENVNGGGESLPAVSLSLDEWMPAADDFLAGQDDVIPSNPESRDPAATINPSDAIDDVANDGEVSNEADDLPDESPQRTRVKPVTAVALPPLKNSQTSTILWPSAVEDLELDFPIPVALAMRADDDGWSIHDTRKDILVAGIGRQGDVTQLRWAEAAKTSANASALSHGRLTADDGRVIHLRPLIESDPWPIRLDQADVRPTWDLHEPIPPRVTRIATDVDLPEGIQLGWIEPIDPSVIRRTRGLAVLTPTDDETVALAMRMDIRCGRKLSCRIRFAARLDPTMPWQFVSSSGLSQFADRLTQQAAAVSVETTRLSAVSDRADTSARRQLRVQQQRVEELGESIRMASERVAHLQSLIAQLETEATLRFCVSVQWPDGEQTILEMNRTDQ